MKRLNLITCALAILLLSISVFATSHENENSCEDLNKSELKALKKLLSYTDKTLNTKKIEKVAQYTDSDCLPLELLSKTLLFKNDPEKNMEEFIEIFAIHDYVLRFTGNYNIITGNEMLERVTRFEGKLKGEKGKALDLLLSYCHFKDTNEWYMVKGKRRSCARFFRAAYLTFVLEENASPIVNAIDRLVERNDLLEFNKGEKLLTHIEHLVKSGKDLNNGLPGGFTLLHFAAEAGNKRAVIRLLELGENPSLASKSGVKAVEMAKREGHQEIVKILENAHKSSTVKKSKD